MPKQGSIARTIKIAIFIAFSLFAVAAPAHATTGINEQLNYQARLLQSTGAVVPDGTYNMEFKIYQDGDGVLGGSDEVLKWTESRTSGNKVTVTNGYFSVQLGSVTPFSNSIDWNQDTLWLSLNVGGTGTPSWDGEMSPFRRLASTAYAINAKQLGGLDWSKFVQVAPSAVQTDTSSLTTLFLNKNNASGNILQLQKSGADVLSVANNGLVTFSTDADFTLAGTENITVTNTTGSNAVDLFSLTLTNNDGGSATQRGLVLANANSTGITESLLALDNADTTTSSLTDGLIITSTGVNNGIVDAIDVSDANITNGINLGNNNLIVNGDTINDFTGNAGLAVSSNALIIDATTTSTTATTSSNSGLEIGADGLRLLGGCTSGSADVLKWNGSTWACAADNNSGGSTAWDSIGDPLGNGAIAFGQTTQTMDFAITSANASLFSFNFANNGGSAGTDSGLVINNAVSSATTGDLNTENLLLIQQLDTTASGTTAVDNALKIDVAASSGIVDGVEITNSGGNLTNAINIADTAGGTLTTGVLFAGTIGHDIDTSGNRDLTLATNGTTRLTLAGDGSRLTFVGGMDLLLSGAGSFISNPQDNFANSEAFGLDATVSAATNATAVGNGASALGSRSVAFGRLASANSDDGVVLGYGASNVNSGGLAIGFQATAGFGAIAIGYQSSALNSNTIALHGTTTANNQFVAGTDGGEITNVYFGSGVTDATPTGFTLQATGGSGSNIAGASLSIAGGVGTGTGNGGNITLQVAKPGTTGSAANSLANVMTVSGVDGSVSLQNAANNAAALGVKTTGGLNTFTVDTLNAAAKVGDITNSANLNVYGEITRKGFTQQVNLANVTDVYVYDTARDSDGGAWANNDIAKSSSWYNEAKDDGADDACNISTDDRCDGSRFPQKAIIVSTPSAVYIFDAADYKLFMKFTQSGTFALGADSNNNPSGVFAVNGVVYAGTNGTSGSGMYAFDFTTDRMFNYDATDRSQGDKNIANRNSTVAYSTNNQTSFALGNSIVNDVHGAVVSGAITATAATVASNGTTLIVAATDSSASLINLSTGRTLDYGDNATDDVNQVWLTKRGRLYLTNETLSQVELYAEVDLDVADQITPDDIYDEQAANTPNLAKTTPTMATTPDALQVIERASFADENFTTSTAGLQPGDVLYVGHSLGLTEIHVAAGASTTNIGWSKFYTTSTETGYMSGTPRAMFGFDDASGDVTDATMRSNVLEAKGTPTYRVNGVHGMAMGFNGTSQYVCSDANNDAACDTDGDFDPGTISFTIEAWFKHAATISGTDTLIDHTYATTPALAAGYRIYMNSSGQMVAGIDDDATTFDDDLITTTTSPSFADGQWHHLVFERVSTALVTPAQAVGTYLYIDGRLVGSDTSIAATATLNGSAILGIGADCSVGAACATGANFWDGQIDDVYISMNGATASDSLNATAGAVARRYQEGKAALNRPSTMITDATAVSSTTLGDSSAAYVPNEFVGEIVEITGGTGAGQTRRITANDATTFTVTPAWTVVPDTTSDYEVMPEQLYGATNSVTSVGIGDNEFLGQLRTLYVGTSDGNDGGGVTAFGGYGTPAVGAVYHSDAGISDDAATATWSGTDADDVQTVEVRSGMLMFGSLAKLWFQKDDRNVEQNLDLVMNNLSSIRQELTTDTLQGTSSVPGNTGGVDLAENYTSGDPLVPGAIVALDDQDVGGVKKSSQAYQKDMLGVVSTAPGMVLGTTTEDSYPIALVGRVPVMVTTEGGPIKAGDRITASSLPGYGMRATQAGRVVGAALDALTETAMTDCPIGVDPVLKCGVITVFVNLVDYNGQDVTTATDEAENQGQLDANSVLGTIGDQLTLQTGLTPEQLIAQQAQLTKADKILRYLAGRPTLAAKGSDVLAGTVVATDVTATTIAAQNVMTLNMQVANGLTVGGPARFNGDSFFYKLVTFVEKTVFKNDLALEGHLTTAGTLPTVLLEPAAGSAAPTSTAAVAVEGTDIAGKLSVTLGEESATGKVASLHFAKPYAAAPRVLLSPANQAAAQSKYYVESTPDGFSIFFTELAPAGTSTTYNYWVVQ